MVDVGVSKGVHDQDGGLDCLGNVDSDLAGAGASRPPALAVAGIDCLKVEGVDVDEEEADGEEEAEDAEDDAEGEYAAEGLEGEPGFVAELLEAALGLVVLHLNIPIKLS